MLFTSTATALAKTTESNINFGIPPKTVDTGIHPNYVSPNPPTPGYTGYCSVTAEPYLIVRSGPGTSYSQIGTALYGDWVYVVQVRTDGWTKIQNLSGSGYGYVSTAYLAKVN
jgi:uncharacterized protein YgiM (DUF1202 family)